MSDGPEDFKAVFKKRRQLQHLLTIPLILVLAGFVALDESHDNTLLGIPGLWVVAICVIVTALVVYYSLRTWRCPSCNKRLPPEGAWSPLDKCSNCGVKLS